MEVALKCAIKEMKIFDTDGNLLIKNDLLNEARIYRTHNKCFIAFEQEVMSPKLLQLVHMDEIPKLSDFDKESNRETIIKIGSQPSEKHYKMTGKFVMIVKDTYEEAKGSIVVKDFKFVDDYADILRLSHEDITIFSNVIQCFEQEEKDAIELKIYQ